MAGDNSKLGGLRLEVGVVCMSRYQTMLGVVEGYFWINFGRESLEPPGCETVFVRLVLCAILGSVSTSAVSNAYSCLGISARTAYSCLGISARTAYSCLGISARTAYSCLGISVGNRCCKSIQHQLSAHRYFDAVVGCCVHGTCIIFHSIDWRFFRISEHGLGISECVGVWRRCFMLDFTLKKSEICRLVLSFLMQGMYLIVKSVAGVPQFVCPKIAETPI
jgi:hypothetical protein